MGNSLKSNIISRVPQIEDIPEDNGLVYMDQFIPEEIFFRIFSCIPAKELLCSVSRVCQNWRHILHQNGFWLYKIKYDGIRLSSKFRSELLNHTSKQEQEREVLKCLQNISIMQPFNRNLIINPSGKDGLQYWRIKRGGDGIIVEEPPIGADPIPDEAGLPSQHCFVTSFSECKRMQQIDLQSLGVTPWVMNTLKPRISASEWVTSRWDCDSWSELTLLLLRDEEVLAQSSVRYSSRDDGMVNRKWYKIEVEHDDYPEGVTSIRYLSRGKDHQFWAGHYGAKSAGSAVYLHL